jgi:hypothetical protein
MNFGFSLESISMNQFDFNMCVDASKFKFKFFNYSDDPLAKLKTSLTRG